MLQTMLLGIMLPLILVQGNNWNAQRNLAVSTDSESENTEVSMPISAFHAYRTSDYDTLETTIPYDGTSLNTDNSLDTAKGVFTAPVNGLYYFYFSATKKWGIPILTIRLMKNDVGISTKEVRLQANGTSGPANNILSVDLHATFALNVNATVKVNLIEGALTDSKEPSNERFTTFTGFLIQPV